MLRKQPLRLVGLAVVFVIFAQREDADYQLHDRENQTYRVKNIHVPHLLSEALANRLFAGRAACYTLTHAHNATGFDICKEKCG